MPDQRQLRELQAPLKQLYSERPETALITLTAEGVVDFKRIGCRVPLLFNDGRELLAGLHPAAAGNGMMACSGELLLQALVTCAGTTFAAVATAMDLRIFSCRIVASAVMDFRGTMGVDRDVPVGIQSLQMVFQVRSDAAKEQLQKLLSLTERYCVVYQTLSAGAAITAQLQLLQTDS